MEPNIYVIHQFQSPHEIEKYIKTIQIKGIIDSDSNCEFIKPFTTLNKKEIMVQTPLLRIYPNMTARWNSIHDYSSWTKFNTKLLSYLIKLFEECKIPTKNMVPSQWTVKTIFDIKNEYNSEIEYFTKVAENSWEESNDVEFDATMERLNHNQYLEVYMILKTHDITIPINEQPFWKIHQIYTQTAHEDNSQLISNKETSYLLDTSVID